MWRYANYFLFCQLTITLTSSHRFLGLSRYWIDAWWHQDIIWNNVGLLSYMYVSRGFYPGTISQEMIMNLTRNLRPGITLA